VQEIQCPTRLSIFEEKAAVGNGQEGVSDTQKRWERITVSVLRTPRSVMRKIIKGKEVSEKIRKEVRVKFTVRG
jgi:hypothetical protein